MERHRGNRRRRSCRRCRGFRGCMRADDVSIGSAAPPNMEVQMTVVTANAQQAADPRVQDLVRAGKLRAALFLPQFTRNTVTGEIRGDVHLVETARALATRLGVELMLVDYPTPPKAVEGLKVGACDVAFLGINPSRAADVAFSPPFV